MMKCKYLYYKYKVFDICIYIYIIVRRVCRNCFAPAGSVWFPCEPRPHSRGGRQPLRAPRASIVDAESLPFCLMREYRDSGLIARFRVFRTFLENYDV